MLTDKEKRDVYDRHGLEGLKDGVGGTGLFYIACCSLPLLVLSYVFFDLIDSI